MTPFDTWYSTHIAPTIPTDAPAIVQKLSREMMAACWNAALDAVGRTKFTREEFPIPCGLPNEIIQQIRGLAARAE